MDFTELNLLLRQYFGENNTFRNGIGGAEKYMKQIANS